ncbi:ribbon-helix-helix protein, CopG family [Glaciihabitans sp. UYNi722]|uniref:ribbon-helix-helix protein, CopG family n=1 Tax=Glaciihabitans sp. UYNi722 TaxID=3156344 RepID=UPI003397ECDF
MAMNVRIPEELDRQLDELAAREHVSKHSLLLQGAELMVRTRARREDVDRGIDFVLAHDAEILERLADA